MTAIVDNTESKHFSCGGKFSRRKLACSPGLEQSVNPSHPETAFNKAIFWVLFHIYRIRISLQRAKESSFFICAYIVSFKKHWFRPSAFNSFALKNPFGQTKAYVESQQVTQRQVELTGVWQWGVWIPTCSLPDLRGTLKSKDIELHILKTTDPEVMAASQHLWGSNSLKKGKVNDMKME